MKQRLRVLLNRSSIYVALTFPHPLTISLMCRLNELPYGISGGRQNDAEPMVSRLV